MKPNRICPGFDLIEGVFATEKGVEKNVIGFFVNTLGFYFGDDMVKVAHKMPNV